jgi:hypothetical protein
MCAQWCVRIFLVIWAASLTVVGACLMVSHWVPLPNSTANQLTHENALLRADDGRWTVFHFLYTECPCSRRVLEHLLARSPRQDVDEQIVLIGHDPDLAARAQANGFKVDHVAAIDLKSKYGVEAAPLLVVVDPTSQICYSGGYTNRKRGFEVQDTTIVSKLLAGKAVETLPVYGCAVSKSLQTIVDPLRIKPSSRD